MDLQEPSLDGSCLQTLTKIDKKSKIKSKQERKHVLTSSCLRHKNLFMVQ